ncbi:MAG: hypothetical protein KAI47_05140, partial [Deltaproteobacteria bacterium]|nr:hypothetical protein [Deltaproteobacteria bacterium]
GGAGGLLLLSLSHAFYGMVLGTALLIAVLARPRPTRLLRGRFLRLAGLGLITLASLLYWLIPLLQTRAFAGGWPWGGADRWQGYGIAHVAEVLFTGRLFDQGQLPALTLGLALGIVITIRRWREAGAARMIILSFSFSLLFLIGRRTLGHLVDIQPMNLGLQLFRYIGAVHFFGVALAGIGLAALARFTRHHLGGLAALTLLVALLASPEIAQGIRAHGLFRTISAYDKATARELRAIGAAIDRDADTQDKHQGKHQAQGRVYAHNKVGTGTHFIAALLAANTHQPLGQSYGVGMHDSLGFYYLEYLSPSSRKLLDLYGFRWMLVERGGTFDTRERKAGHAPIATSRKLAVYRRTRRPGLFSVGEASFVLVGDPRPLRPAIQMWLRSRLPAQHRFGIIIPASSAKGHASDIDLRRLAWLHRVGDTSAIARSGPGGRGPWKTTRLPWRNLPGSATGATGAIGTTSTISTTSPPGHLLPEPYAPRGARDPGVASSTHLGLRYNARVAMTRPGLVVLAVSAHPFWHAEVDGHPVTSLHVTPAFVAVRVPRGVHTVRFAFENPTYQKILVLITLAAWMLLLIALGVTGPKSKHTHQDRRDP